MSDFLRLAAYAFLALMGMSAWNTYSGGWRYYFGICLFIVSILRILTILRQRMAAKKTARRSAAGCNPALHGDSGTPEQPPAAQ
jgi:hypothetical protein